MRSISSQTKGEIMHKALGVVAALALAATLAPAAAEAAQPAAMPSQGERPALVRRTAEA